MKCVPTTEDLEDDPPCSYNSMLFEFTVMQYIICCLCFSISKPFRKPVWTNPLYLLSVTCMTLYGLSLIWFEISSEYFMLLSFQTGYRKKLLICIALDALLSYLYESVFISYLNKWWTERQQKLKNQKRQSYV